MSIEELEESYGGPGPSGFDRTPPQDVAAEMSVLGGMLLSKDAIADVIEQIRGSDFYRPAHEIVYESIIDLYGRGEPADAITVVAELTKRGELQRIGGAPYIHDLMAGVPTAANAGYYARIVRERAVLRRLVEAGTRIVQLGYATDGGDVDEIVNNAQAEVYAVTERRTTEDYLPLSEILGPTFDEIEAAQGRGEGMTGVPTGYSDFDRLTNGLHPGQMIVVAARPAIGKALALDTPLPTPSGWTTMGEVAVGDLLVSADGTPTRVVAATEVMVDRPCYEVELDDGTVIVADAQHQWVTSTRAQRRAVRAGETPEASVRTTEELAATVRCATADNRANHSIATTAPLDLPEADLPIHPYALGVWLGDGSSRRAEFTSADPEIAMRIEGLGHVAHPTSDDLLALGLPAAGEIPVAYLRASETQRRELLAGLLDTDGTVTPQGSVQISLTSERLALQTRELALSLGYRTGWSTKAVQGRTESSSTAYTITFTTEDDVFWLERKRLVHKERRRPGTARLTSRFVVDVRRVDPVPVRCVEVDHPSHLYLAGRSMVPTHNSVLGINVATHAAVHHQMAAVIFSLEMSRNEITMRLLAAEAKVPLTRMRSGKMDEQDWQKLASTMGKVAEAPLFIDDSPNMSLMEIRAKCRRLKQRHDLKLVVIDYLQLMSSGKRVESRQQEVSEFSRALKLLAKELEVPVIAISQLNRGPEQRGDKKPQMSDLRESGCLTEDTKILRADTGAETSLGELFALNAKDVPVWALNDRLQYVRRHLTHVFPTGVKPVFRMRLASGKEIEATANHPFLTYDGWTALGDLEVGSRIGVPRHVPGPERNLEWDDRKVVMLAHLLGNGPSRAARTEHMTATGAAQSASAAWLDDLGLRAAHTSEAFVPTSVFHLPKRQIALFVKHLWSTSADVGISADGSGGRIRFSSASRAVVDGVARLLLRFGISTNVRPGLDGSFALDIAERDDQRRFLQEIGLEGSQSENAAELLAIVRSKRSASHVDTGPQHVWDVVRDLLVEEGPTAIPRLSVGKGTAGSDDALWRNGLSRHRLGKIAAVLESEELEIMAVNDLLWDEVVSIEPMGEKQVYDATVLDGHNFVANGIAAHNSIEQDADVVILLHREDAYEKESPRAGEADLIVAKHRNGPTDTITVAFQGHYQRFADMQM
ncbi:replicative DNA helicase [Cellulosimicrobium cellulans]|nr:replicative DNA helicase [Sphaerisporangium cinnabarinum]PTU56559.1 replicative DNA helicase [Sphaerisporangium cinnabarinum]SDF18216.1 replicative DNA helicase [Cellulosimicrobium cellulans]